MGFISSKKALAVAAAAGVSVMATVVIPRTFGAGGFSATTTNAGNAFSAGTLTMKNSNGTGECLTGTVSASCGVLISASNIEPGASGNNTVTITNSGSLPATLSLGSVVTHATASPAPAGTGSGDLSGELTLKITEVSYTPSGGSAVADGVVLYNSSFSGVPGSVALCGTGGYSGGVCTTGHTQWPAGEAHLFKFEWTLPGSADNTYQGTSANLDATWTAIQ